MIIRGTLQCNPGDPDLQTFSAVREATFKTFLCQFHIAHVSIYRCLQPRNMKQINNVAYVVVNLEQILVADNGLWQGGSVIRFLSVSDAHANHSFRRLLSGNA